MDPSNSPALPAALILGVRSFSVFLGPVAAREGRAKLLLLIDREDGLEEEANAQAEEIEEEKEEEGTMEEEGSGSMKPSILWNRAAARTTSRRRRHGLRVRLLQLLLLLRDGLDILLLGKGGVAWQTSFALFLCCCVSCWDRGVMSRVMMTTTGGVSGVGAAAWIRKAAHHTHAQPGNDHAEHCPSVVVGL